MDCFGGLGRQRRQLWKGPTRRMLIRAEAPALSHSILNTALSFKYCWHTALKTEHVSKAAIETFESCTVRGELVPSVIMETAQAVQLV